MMEAPKEETPIVTETPVIVEEPKKELTEEELAGQAYMQIQATSLSLKNKLAFLDRNALNRILNALIGFPFDENAMKLIQKKKTEVEVFMAIKGLDVPKKVVNDFIIKKHGDVQEQAAHNVANEVIEANQEFKPNKKGDTNV